MRKILCLLAAGWVVAGESTTQIFAANLFLRVLLFSTAFSMPALAANPIARADAHYALIYSDDIETLTPRVGSAFALDDVAGSLTSAAGEVIGGQRSIRGSHSGPGSYSHYLNTVPSVLSLTAGQIYKVTFDYRILETPSVGFEVLFYSPTGGGAGNWLPSTTVTGVAGDTGSATLTNTLGPYNDYRASWDVEGTGAISIDNIVITNVTTNTIVAIENAEGVGLNVGSGLQLHYDATIVEDPAQVIAGSGSVKICNYGLIATDPTALPLAANTTYIIEFQYRILSSTDQEPMYFQFQPPGNGDTSTWVDAPGMLQNAPSSGTVSAGALTGSAPNYVFNINSGGNTCAIVDSIRVYRQDQSQSTALPSRWGTVASLPFPRLGRYQLGKTRDLVYGVAEGVPFTYTLEQIESRLALNDVIVGMNVDAQSIVPDSVRRLRSLNPNMLILPYRIAEEQASNIPTPAGSTTSLEYDFVTSLPASWYVRDTNGTVMHETDFPPIGFMNISSFAPVVGGQTYNSRLVSWLTGTVLASGIWDGIFLDNLFGRTNFHILNAPDPALLDYDWNRNGIRDETPNSSNDMTRMGAVDILGALRAQIGDTDLVIGNAGAMPELPLAQYVNGYAFECLNTQWDGADRIAPSAASWRGSLDAYLRMQQTTRSPHLNIMQACSRLGSAASSSGGVTGVHLTPTAADIDTQRFTMGTALLGNGFYTFDLVNNLSAPYWFDEYSVNASGVATEDRGSKGYLGQALGDAVELPSGNAMVFQENFESGNLTTFGGIPAQDVWVSSAAGEVISGSHSLVITNPDYSQMGYIAATTNSGVLQATAGDTFLVTFDWRVVNTLGVIAPLIVSVNGAASSDTYNVMPAIAVGDAGTVHYPVTATSSGTWSLTLALGSGGGRVAIDNIRVVKGGAGPWRRDFENGFVLVNPLPFAKTFSAADVAGSLNRTGVHRILGTQAPAVNNGQSVNSGLTLQPFDAIILLADKISLIFRDGFE